MVLRDDSERWLIVGASTGDPDRLPQCRGEAVEVDRRIDRTQADGAGSAYRCAIHTDGVAERHVRASEAAFREQAETCELGEDVHHLWRGQRAVDRVEQLVDRARAVELRQQERDAAALREPREILREHDVFVGAERRRRTDAGVAPAVRAATSRTPPCRESDGEHVRARLVDEPSVQLSGTDELREVDGAALNERHELRRVEFAANASRPTASLS